MSFMRKKMNSFLMKRGLASLDDKNVIHQLAFLVRDHQHFCAMLHKVEPEKRKVAYETMKPYLRFEAKSLFDYEAMARTQASEREKAGINVTPIDEIAQQAIKRNQAKGSMTMTCGKCLREETFFASDSLQAIFEARQKGWVMQKMGEEKEIEVCPKCPAFRPVQMKVGNA